MSIENLAAALIGQHLVTFNAVDGQLLARCCCGWSYGWEPNTFTTQPGDYGTILWYGVEHTLDAKDATRVPA